MKSVLIGGQAGQGIEKAAGIMAKALQKLGLYVFNYRDYQSLIRGGHNYNVITFDSRAICSNEWEYDIIVALDNDTEAMHGHGLKGGGSLISGKDFPDVPKMLEGMKLPPVSKNTFFVGAVAKMLGMDYDAISCAVAEELGEEQLKVLKEGYGRAEKMADLEKGNAKNSMLTSGSVALAQAAIDSGLERFIGYPMTPATPVFHYLASKQTEKMKAIQMENEIGVIHAAIGASFAGKMSMCATSSGGMALMGEACSLIGMSEIPLVINLAQRSGPASGIPTYSLQADLKMALNIGHGEFLRIVLAPGLPDEAYEMTQEAFYLAHKYNTLAIILTDKHVAESTFTIGGYAKPKNRPSKNIINAGKDYAFYAFTETGISPRAIPGANDAVVKATSYEHDERSNTTEDADMAVRMNDKRLLKVETLRKELPSLEPVKVYGKGNKAIVGWGSTKGAILDAIKQLPGYKYVQVRYLSPFPVEELLRELEESEDVVCVEYNATGQLADVIAEQTGFIIEKRILKYDSRPFSAKEIIEAVNDDEA